MVCEPFRDEKIIADFLEGLGMKRNGFVYQMYFELGLSTALRVSDLLSLRKKDIEGRMVKLKTQKTGMYRHIALNDSCYQSLTVYLKNKKEDDLLFPFTRQNVHKFMKETAKFIGIDASKVSSHTLRKTAGWFYYIHSNKDLVSTMKFLGHKDPEVTTKYLMIDDYIVNESLVTHNIDWRNMNVPK